MSIHTEGKVYKVRWREGKRQRSRTFYTRRDAETYELERKRRKSMGGVPITAGDQDFNTFVDEWWEAHKTTLAPATQQLYEGTLDRYIRPFFSGCRMHDLTPRAVKQFRAALAGEGKGEPTQIKCLVVLSGICASAVEDEVLAANPVRAIKKPSQGRTKLIEPIPPERVEALRGKLCGVLVRSAKPGVEQLNLAVLEETTFISCLAYTGGRPAEIYEGLTWADIHYGLSGAADSQSVDERFDRRSGPAESGFLILHGEKTGRDRQVRLLSPLAADLRAWRKASGVEVGQVFGWSQSKYRNWARKHFAPAAKELGLNVTPYALRHSFASLLLSEGRGLPYVAKQLGHSLLTCSRSYTHLEHLQERQIPAEEQIRRAREGLREVANG